MNKKLSLCLIMSGLLLVGSLVSNIKYPTAIRSNAETNASPTSLSITNDDIDLADDNAGNGTIWLRFKEAHGLEISNTDAKRYSANTSDGIITVLRGEELLVTGGLLTVATDNVMAIETSWGFDGAGAVTFQVGDVITINGAFTKKDGSGSTIVFDNFHLKKISNVGYRVGDYVNFVLGDNLEGTDWWCDANGILQSNTIPFKTKEDSFDLPVRNDNYGYYNCHADDGAAYWVKANEVIPIGTSVVKTGSKQYVVVLYHNSVETHGCEPFSLNYGDRLVLNGTFTNPHTGNSITFDGVVVTRKDETWEFNRLTSVDNISYDNTEMRSQATMGTINYSWSMNVNSLGCKIGINQGSFINWANPVGVTLIDGETNVIKNIPLLLATYKDEATSKTYFEIVFYDWKTEGATWTSYNNFTGFINELAGGDQIEIVSSILMPDASGNQYSLLNFHLKFYVDENLQLTEFIEYDYSDSDIEIYSVLNNGQGIQFNLTDGIKTNDTFPLIQWVAGWDKTYAARGNGDITIIRDGEEYTTINSVIYKEDRGEVGIGYAINFESWVLPSDFTFQDKDILVCNIDGKLINPEINAFYELYFEFSLVYDADFADINNYSYWCLYEEHADIVKIHDIVNELSGKEKFTTADGVKIKEVHDLYYSLSYSAKEQVKDYLALFDAFYAQVDLEVETLCNTYLLMNSVSTDNISNTGVCLTKYAEAKAYYLSMTEDAKWNICNKSEYADVVARLQAWAMVNGESFTTENNGTFTNHASLFSNPLIRTMDSNFDVAIIVIVSSLALITIASLVIVKKRKTD